MVMNCSKLEIASISDVHLGNNRVPARDTIASLDREFPANDRLAILDIVFIGGDLFDRLLNLPDDAVSEIKMWMARFLRRCKRFDVVVRVLEGTPSHDWKQNRIFVEINEMAEIGCDLKYHSILEIDRIERFGIDVLYVPDEWEFETDDTWKQVCGLLNEKGLDKVDFAIMHGAFDYQLPSHVQAPTHDEDRYLSIVRHYILIGHIHRHLPKGRIIPNGSFDRLAHGEQEDKGYVRLTVRKDGDDDIVFMPNSHAKRFDTVDCSGMEIADALKAVEKVCNELPDDSYIRIKANRDDPVVGGLSSLKDRYPLLNWDTKFSTNQQSGTSTLDDLNIKYKGVEITRENITQLMVDRIRPAADDEDLVKRCLSHLEEAM